MRWRFAGTSGTTTLLDEIRAGRYDAMALTSLELPGGLMEGIPVALMEAMALGLPVVTTATGSITELVDDALRPRRPARRRRRDRGGRLRELAGDPPLRARPRARRRIGKCAPNSTSSPSRASSRSSSTGRRLRYERASRG